MTTATVPDLGPKYEVRRLLGRGGMGSVWEIRHRALDRILAAKVLNGPSVDGEALERLRREALAATRLKDPHIVEVLDFDRAPDGTPFIVMERLVGEELTARLSRTAPLSGEAAIDLLRTIAGAAAKAHAVGLVHRDLKPANIFLAGDPMGGETLKILDFGLTKFMDGTAPALTISGLGTLAYVSPEQACNRDVDGRADVFALGMILHEALTAHHPYEKLGPRALATQLLSEEPVPVDGEMLARHPALAAVVRRALEKERDDRFADMGAFIAALDEAREGRAPAPAPSAVRAGRRRRGQAAVLALAGTLTVLLAGGAVVGWLRARPPAVTSATAPSSLSAEAQQLALVGAREPRALRHFTTGVRSFDAFRFDEAADHFGRARMAEPDFAFAHVMQAVSIGYFHRERAELYRVALADVDRLPVAERDFFHLLLSWHIDPSEDNARAVVEHALARGAPHHRALVAFLTQPPPAKVRALLAQPTPFLEPLAFPARRLDALASAAMASSDRAAAITASEEYIRLFPDEEDPLLQRAQVALWAGELDAAEKWLARGAATASTDLSVRYEEVVLCGERGRWRCALDKGDASRFPGGGHWDRMRRGALCAYAWRYQQTADLDRLCEGGDVFPPWPQLAAVSRHRKPSPIVMGNPSHLHAAKALWYQRLVDGYQQLLAGHPEEALRLLPDDLLTLPDQANWLGPFVALELRCRAHAALGHTDEALREIDRLLAVNPSHAFSRVARADVLAAAGRKEEARVELRRALEVWRDADDLPPVAAARSALMVQ